MASGLRGTYLRDDLHVAQPPPAVDGLPAGMGIPALQGAHSVGRWGGARRE